MYFSTLCSLRLFTVDFFVMGPSYTHCCRALTLALARLSCFDCHAQKLFDRWSHVAPRRAKPAQLGPRAGTGSRTNNISTDSMQDILHKAERNISTVRDEHNYSQFSHSAKCTQQHARPSNYAGNITGGK